jgi:hypothetical protein
MPETLTPKLIDWLCRSPLSTLVTGCCIQECLQRIASLTPASQRTHLYNVKREVNLIYKTCAILLFSILKIKHFLPMASKSL